MATTIKINPSAYINGFLVTDIAASLADSTLEKGTVKAAFTELLPWANLASKEAFDFYFIAALTYGVDRFIPRKAHSVDGWSREINVSFPVYNIAKWKSCKEDLEQLLSFLTGDYWTVQFSKNKLELPAAALSEQYQGNFSRVALFSGGLDSLIGAIDQMEKDRNPGLYISHYDPLMAGPKKDQTDLSKEMETQYGDLYNHISSIKVFLSDTSFTRGQRETTCRSRSLLFIGLALLLADAKKINILVPENGTVSLNYPLSPSRRSSCSTRTTHPTVLSFVSAIFSKLGINSAIENPYRFNTKGEMVAQCQNPRFLKKVIAISNSCGKRGHRAHWDYLGSHCGICMPCIYRRASVLSGDTTEYGNDGISNANANYFLKRKGQDEGAMLQFLNNKVSDTAIKIELIAGGLRDQANLYKYINLIKRTRKELEAWLKKNGNRFAKAKAGL
jgi:7-cyano-7-deazaguanine synthase in queuosine biosynthesis